METLIIGYNYLKNWEQEISDNYFGAETLFATIKTGIVWLTMDIIMASEIQEWGKAVAAILGALVIAFKLGQEVYKWRKRKDIYGNKDINGDSGKKGKK